MKLNTPKRGDRLYKIQFLKNGNLELSKRTYETLAEAKDAKKEYLKKGTQAFVVFHNPKSK